MSYSLKTQLDVHAEVLELLNERLPFLTASKKGVRDFICINKTLTVRAEGYALGKGNNFYVEYLTPSKALSKAWKAAKAHLTYFCHLMNTTHLFLFDSQQYVDAIEAVRTGETLNIAALSRHIEQIDGRKSVGWAVPQNWMIETIPCIAAINVYRNADVTALEQLVTIDDKGFFDYTEGCLRTKAMDKELNAAGIYLPKPEPARKEPKSVKPVQPALMLG